MVYMYHSFLILIASFLQAPEKEGESHTTLAQI